MGREKRMRERRELKKKLKNKAYKKKKEDSKR
jgi:hypothetical protein